MSELSFEHGSLLKGDCREVLEGFAPSSVHMVLTDPPYFLDRMGDDWDSKSLAESSDRASIIGGRPVGMKFDRGQGYAFEQFIGPVATQIFHLLKPGGFFVSFSQARLYHRLAVAVEDSGFEIRDMLAWNHNGQAKAFSQSHFIRKMALSDVEKEHLIEKLAALKTPQLKPQLEPMVLAQKPKEGTYVENWLAHGVGLMDSSESLDSSFPGNLMPVARPSKSERGATNSHMTVKPLRLLEHLIRLFTPKEAVILDPFVGSGSTAVAAINTDRRFLCIERDDAYYQIAEERIRDAERSRAERVF